MQKNATYHLSIEVIQVTQKKIELNSPRQRPVNIQRWTYERELEVYGAVFEKQPAQPIFHIL